MTWREAKRRDAMSQRRSAPTMPARVGTALVQADCLTAAGCQLMRGQRVLPVPAPPTALPSGRGCEVCCAPWSHEQAKSPLRLRPLALPEQHFAEAVAEVVEL